MKYTGEKAKRRVEDLRWKLNVDYLARLGFFSEPGTWNTLVWRRGSAGDVWAQLPIFFTPYHSEGFALQLINGSAIKLTSTRPHLGGKRWLFLCPGCGRRARILYVERLSNPFLCRRCLSLRYETQLLHEKERALRKVHNVRKPFDWDLSPYSPFPPPSARPAHMRIERYCRLWAKEHEAATKYLAVYRAEIARAMRRIERLGQNLRL